MSCGPTDTDLLYHTQIFLRPKPLKYNLRSLLNPETCSAWNCPQSQVSVTLFLHIITSFSDVPLINADAHYLLFSILVCIQKAADSTSFQLCFTVPLVSCQCHTHFTMDALSSFDSDRSSLLSTSPSGNHLRNLFLISNSQQSPNRQM